MRKLALTEDVNLRFDVARLLDLVRGKLKDLYLPCIVNVKDRRSEEDWVRRALTEGWSKTLGIDDDDGLPMIECLSPQQLKGIGCCQ